MSTEISIRDLADELGTAPEAVAGMAHQLVGEDGSDAVYVEMEPARNASGRTCSHGRMVDISGLMVDSGKLLTGRAADEIRENFAEWLMQDVDVWLLAGASSGTIAVTTNGGVAVLTEHDPYESVHEPALRVVAVVRCCEPDGNSHTFEHATTEAARACFDRTTGRSS